MMKQETIRQNLLHQLARKSLSIARDRAIIAIDGVDGSGKTTLADELSVVIAAFGRNVVRASIDGFHHPRERRYLRGRSPEGYFLDSYDYDEFKQNLLLPFHAGARFVKTAHFDHRVDRQVTRRYLHGQRLYMRLCNPYERADVLVDNADLDAPRISREGDRHPDV